MHRINYPPHHIEDGYEANQVTGVVLVDLSAAYDTVNVKRLLNKLTALTDDQAFIRILSEMLHNRRFMVQLNSEKSRWRNSKKGKVLASRQCACPHFI